MDFTLIDNWSERYSGWVKRGLFSISYKSGKICMNNPIFNKAIGRISTRKGVTVVSFRTYRGLTDILSLAILFAGSFAIILATSSQVLDIGTIALLSLFCCSLAAVITYTFTSLSSEGREGEEYLIGFLERVLELTNR
ncbi:SMODS and SLOG-associating 2TM effector domain-containing protein [Paenibacillus tarimensis]